MDVVLKCVSSEQEIRENMNRFVKGALLDLGQVATLAKSVKYWIFDADCSAFGPNTFLGYKEMNFEKYAVAQRYEAGGVDFDGTLARNAIESVLGTRYAPDLVLSAKLYEFLSEIVGAVKLNGVNQNKWRFLSLPPKNYWAVFCDPKRFDGERACRDLRQLTWTWDRGAPEVGDGVIVWQGKGNNVDRGIVGIGRILHEPQLREEIPGENKYWRINPEEKVLRRCLIELLPANRLPLWWSVEKDHLSDLKVAKARGGTVFHLTQGQWQDILRLSQTESKTVQVEPEAGQGFQSDSRVKRAVEAYAQNMAASYFQKRGYSVTDVSSKASYDLHCQKDDEVHYVEAKGTTTKGDYVFLTKNEVELARNSEHETVLFIVSEIEIERIEDRPQPKGGKSRVYRNWLPEEADLTPLQYQYRIRDRK